MEINKRIEYGLSKDFTLRYGKNYTSLNNDIYSPF